MKSTTVIAPLRQTPPQEAPAVEARPSSPGPQHIADGHRGLRHVFVRDLVITCSIGIYDHERTAPQRIRVNVDLGVLETNDRQPDSISDVVCYEQIVNRVRAIANDGHTDLVEILAERFAALCLQDPRVRSARVRVEKLDVFSDAASVGVEIERLNPLP